MLEDLIIMAIMLSVIFIPLGLGGIVLYIIDKIEEFKERKEIKKLIKESNRDKIFRYFINDYYL